LHRCKGISHRSNITDLARFFQKKIVASRNEKICRDPDSSRMTVAVQVAVQAHYVIGGKSLPHILREQVP